MLLEMLTLIYRLRALVAKRDWNELEEMSKNRKSPIGWEVSLFALQVPYQTQG